MPNILIIDDDRFLIAALQRLLAKHRHEVRSAYDALGGFRLINASVPDLLILDLNLPDEDGIGICRQIRSRYAFPILMLTSRGDSVSKIVGLNAGADDYLAKPFDPGELIARVHAQLRRSQGFNAAMVNSTRRFGSLLIDADARQVWVADVPLTLSPTEYDILAYLAANSGHAISREQLFDVVWSGYVDSDSNTLNVLVHRLRKKLSAAGSTWTIQTVRAYGFSFSDQSHAPQ